MSCCRWLSSVSAESFSISRRMITLRRPSAILPNEDNSANRAMRRNGLKTESGGFALAAASFIMESSVMWGARVMVRSTKSSTTHASSSSRRLIERPKDRAFSSARSRISFHASSGYALRIRASTSPLLMKSSKVAFLMGSRDKVPIRFTIACPIPVRRRRVHPTKGCPVDQFG